MQAARLRRRAEAENAWVVGKEVFRHGERAKGLARLRASLGVVPGPKRALLLAAAHCLPALPRPRHGPFARYRRATGDTERATVRSD